MSSQRPIHLLKIKHLNRVRWCLNDVLRDLVAEGMSTNDGFLGPLRDFRRDVEAEINYLYELIKKETHV